LFVKKNTGPAVSTTTHRNVPTDSTPHVFVPSHKKSPVVKFNTLHDIGASHPEQGSHGVPDRKAGASQISQPGVLPDLHSGKKMPAPHPTIKAARKFAVRSENGGAEKTGGGN